MPESLRGVAAIVGTGELKPERQKPGRDTMSLLGEACYLAIQDAGLTKQDIDGMIIDPELQGGTTGYNAKVVEHLGIFPKFATGCDAQGAATCVMALHFADDVPYVLAIIELDEGWRMTSNVINIDPKDVTVGMRVEVVFDDVTPEFTLPKFQPVK
jgi:hypothetical protein